MREDSPAEIILSVVVTCFNYESFVEECIESVLNQIIPQVELIIVDDGSTDQSWDIIKKYSERAKVVKIRNVGALQASLHGFGLSSGRFVYFLDADDMLCQNSISLIIPMLNDKISKVQFKLLPVNAAGKVIGRPFPRISKKSDSRTLIKSISRRGYYQTPPTSGNIYRRDVYFDLGDLRYERAIDGVAFLLAPFIGDVLSVETPLAKYRNHGRNLSSFSNLSTEQLTGYSKRFRARIDHLNQILDKKRIDRQGFGVQPSYSYTLGMEIMATVVGGQRPALSSITSHISHVRVEFGLKTLLLLSVFDIFLYLMPSMVGKRLVRFRLDQSYFFRIRGLIKVSYGDNS